jgi:hypothetical protein
MLDVRHSERDVEERLHRLRGCEQSLRAVERRSAAIEEPDGDAGERVAETPDRAAVELDRQLDGLLIGVEHEIGDHPVGLGDGTFEIRHRDRATGLGETVDQDIGQHGEVVGSQAPRDKL